MGKNHIVLDLDESLIFSDEMTVEHQKRMHRRPDYDIVDLQGYLRPFLKQFLTYVTDSFQSVGVWTAGTADYAESIIQQAFDNQGIPRPSFVFSAKDCQARMENISGNRYVKSKYKPLEKLWEKYKDLKPHNTLILDDRTDTARANTDNLMLIPSFSVYAPCSLNDDYLLRFIEYSEEVNLPCVDDVRRLDKTTWWL